MGALLAALSIVPVSGRILTLGRMTTALRSPGGPACSIAPELRDEAIYLRGVDDPTRLRELVAQATSAEWVAEGKGIRLERSKTLRARLYARERATLLADIRVALPTGATPEVLGAEEYARLRHVAESRPDGASEAEMRTILQAMQGVDLKWRTRERFLAALDPERLAGLLAGADGTLVGEPIRCLDAPGFEPLPLRSPSVVAAILTAARAEAELVPFRSVTNPAVAGLDARRRRALATGALGGVLRLQSGRVAFDLVAVAPDGAGGRLSTGALVFPLPRSEESRWPGEALGDDREIPRATDLARARIDPSALDPLNDLVAPFLDGIARVDARPVVIDLPDEARELSGEPLRSFGRASERLRRHVAVELVDGAIVGRPRLPLRATGMRMRRAEYLPWFSALLDPNLTLDAAAAISARVGEGGERTGLLEALAGEMGRDPTPEHPLQLRAGSAVRLRLWAALPPASRASLDAGCVLSGAALGPSLHGELWHAVWRGSGDAELAFLDRRAEPPPLELSWRLRRIPVALAATGDQAGSVYDGGRLGVFLKPQIEGKAFDPADRVPDARRDRFHAGLRMERLVGIVYAPPPLAPFPIVWYESRFDRGEPVALEAMPRAFLDPFRNSLAGGQLVDGGG